MRLWPFKKKLKEPKYSAYARVSPPPVDNRVPLEWEDFGDIPIGSSSYPEVKASEKVDSVRPIQTDPSPIEYSGPLEASDSPSCDSGSSDGGCGGGD